MYMNRRQVRKFVVESSNNEQKMYVRERHTSERAEQTVITFASQTYWKQISHLET